MSRKAGGRVRALPRRAEEAIAGRPVSRAVDLLFDRLGKGEVPGVEVAYKSPGRLAGQQGDGAIESDQAEAKEHCSSQI